ncbi:smr domain-containing protein [Microthyrium microscopicum]|uniref:Smr domain-containing protein n=1 Tax=Microthyrium microscopicum TaxID=703497 RepID=A0A6A6UGB6_9PEZI|nr:smr domain-containing protein [Microthyrium microscopicum]
MSYPMTQIGGRAFNPSHGGGGDTEAEYDRLRGAAREKIGERQSLSAQSQNAYKRGDGAAAHDLSQRAKRVAEEADNFNKQASDYIFRANNAHAKSDEIDLHGQYVEEAEDLVRKRIETEKSRHATHLHVIVGKGNHSVNHIQKIKPAVENICREMGLAYKTEANEGRMYVDLTGNQDMPDYAPEPGQGYHRPDYQGGHQQQHGGGQYHRPPQQTQEEQLVEAGIKKCISCCIIM